MTRFSSPNPNPQNLSIHTPEGRSIRTAFKPAAVHVEVDYSLIEFGMAATFATSDQKCDDQESTDIHTEVAAAVNGITLAEVTPFLRRKAKAVTFGILYSQLGRISE